MKGIMVVLKPESGVEEGNAQFISVTMLLAPTRAMKGSWRNS